VKIRNNDNKNSKTMVNLITPQNIGDVLNEVIKKLEEAEMILGCPGCSTGEIGEIRCEALNSVTKTREIVKNLAFYTYKLR
jgi:hypothetical protein